MIHLKYTMSYWITHYQNIFARKADSLRFWKYNFVIITKQIISMHVFIVRFTLNSSNSVYEFRELLSQFSTIFYGILHTLFSVHVTTTLKI